MCEQRFEGGRTWSAWMACKEQRKRGNLIAKIVKNSGKQTTVHQSVDRPKFIICAALVLPATNTPNKDMMAMNETYGREIILPNVLMKDYLTGGCDSYMM